MSLEQDFFTRLNREPATLVRVVGAEGSVPRGKGAWMAVFVHEAINTIGGGRLELDALTHARHLLQGDDLPGVVRYALGPSLGQCCGGVVHLKYERVQSGDAGRLARDLAGPRLPVALFGAGHVGKALVRVLGTLPVDLTWVDSRDEVFPADLPDNVCTEYSDPVQAAVADLEAGSQVLIMSFSHAQDLDIVAACLLRQRESGDLPYIGLIGSRTKWASFGHRLIERGFAPVELARVTCPIGVPGIVGKEPEVIAVAVAAQLLQQA